MRCPACSAEVRIGDAKCGSCGWDLKQLYTGESRAAQAPRVEDPAATAERPRVAAPPAASPIHAKLEIGTQLGAKLRLDLCDRLFLERYDLGNATPSFLREKTQVCETVEEFIDLLIEDMRCSDSERAGIRKGWIEQGRKDSGVILGVHFPGRGCFLNGPAFLQLFDCDSINELLEHPEACASIASTAVHEKLGHGFISESTATGRERVENGLERLRLAGRFGVETVDTPDHEILNRKCGLVFRTNAVTDEGFSRWLETDLLGELGIGREAEDPEALAAIDPRIAAFVHWAHAPVQDTAAAIYHADFLQGADSDEELAGGVIALSGQPPRYTLGCVLMDALARHHRPELVPAAMLIAYNVTMNLSSLAVGDLRELLADPRFNATARATQLLTLPPCDTAASLADAARELLSFAPPECLVSR